MGTSNSSQPVIIYETEFSIYTKLLKSISKRHPQFDFRIKKIVYENKNNILFKVENIKDKLPYYLEQIQIKDDQDIEMMLKKIQLSVEMTDGFLPNYNTSFATKHGSLVFIVYDYIELTSLDEMLEDNKFQEQRGEINNQVQAQIFSIFYLLNQQQLSIFNLVKDNIYIYQKHGKFFVKLININLTRKHQYQQFLYWELEKYEKKSLKAILRLLQNTNLNKINSSVHLNAIVKDLKDGKYQLQAVQDYFIVYQQQYKLIKIKNIELIDQDRKNLNLSLFKFNKEIINYMSKKQPTHRNGCQVEIIFKQEI